jgi:hypothetical protein
MTNFLVREFVSLTKEKLPKKIGVKICDWYLWKKRKGSCPGLPDGIFSNEKSKFV